MQAEPLVSLQPPPLPVSEWKKRHRKWLSLWGGPSLLEPWTTSPRGTKPGPATLATSRPGQASKYVDYWRENKWESSKQTRDAFGWHFPLRFKHTTIPSFIILHAFHKKGNMSHQTTIQKGMPFFCCTFSSAVSIHCHWRTPRSSWTTCGWELQHLTGNSQTTPTPL